MWLFHCFEALFQITCPYSRRLTDLATTGSGRYAVSRCMCPLNPLPCQSLLPDRGPSGRSVDMMLYECDDF